MIELNEAINCNKTPAESFASSYRAGDTVPVTLNSRPFFLCVSSISKPVFSIETFIRFELSLVREVEKIFIDRESDDEFRVISVVNERDAQIRERVYAREQEIMDTYPRLTFDFHVLARMNRNLDALITKAGKLIFER